MKITSVVLLGGWLWCVSPTLADGQGQAHVAILYGDHASYKNAAVSLKAFLETQNLECSLIAVPKARDSFARKRISEELRKTKPAVIAAAGTVATSFAVRAVHDIPVVFFMVPNVRDTSFLKNEHSDRRVIGGVTTDVSPKDQIDWILRTYPGCKRVAVLHSGRSRKTVESLKAAAEQLGVTIVSIKAHKQGFPKAIAALEEAHCDGLLMVPDAKVYNSASVQRVLLWGLRQKKPVWAFSESIVKAGALAGQYVDRQDIARQTADFVRDLITQKESLPSGVQYPRRYKTAINEHTAAMIKASINRRAVEQNTVRFGGKP